MLRSDTHSGRTRALRSSLLVSLAFAATFALGCGRQAPADVALLVPADAVAAVVAPPLDDLRPPLLGFAGGMEGSQGVIEWIARRYGLDLAAADPFGALGVDGRAGLAVFVRGGLLHVALGVADPKAFDAHVGKQLALFGYGDPVATSGEPLIRTAVDRGKAGVPPFAWGTDAGRAVLAFALSPIVGTAQNDAAPDPAAAVRALLVSGAGESLVTSERFRALTAAPAGEGEAGEVEAGGADVTLWLDLRRTVLTPGAVSELLAPLGLFQGLVRPTVEGFDGLGARLRLANDRLALRARLGRLPDAAPLPVDWLQPAETPADYGAILPSSTSLLLRLRLNARKVSDLPGFLRAMLLQGNPLATWHPYAGTLRLGEDVLPHLTGDVGVAVLGLSDGASLASLDAASSDPARLLREVDLAFLFQVRDPDAFAAVIAERVAAAVAGGARGEAIPEGDGGRAWTLTGGNLRYLGVALEGDVAVIAVGRDTLGRVLRVVKGEAPSLQMRARTDLDRAVVGEEGAAFGAHASFDRVARQLQCKGFPPYFLKVATSPDVMAFRLRVDGVPQAGLGPGAAPTFELEVTQ